jgi:DNA-binding MarR family transcriptional regulator
MRKKTVRLTKAEIRDAEAKAIAGTMKRLMTGYRTLLEVELEKENITLAQLRMLSALNEEPDHSAAGLARTCFITPQSMQAIVTRAEKLGWIRRQPSPANRRVLTAQLTAEGRRVLEKGMGLWTVISREMWADTKLSEMEMLKGVLSSAVDRLQPQLDALHARSAARRKTA